MREIDGLCVDGGGVGGCEVLDLHYHSVVDKDITTVSRHGLRSLEARSGY